MKINKKQLLFSLISIGIIIVSTVFTLLDVLIPLNIWLHPVLNFLFINLLGFGLMLLILAFIKYSPWYFFLSSVCLGLSLEYVLLQYIYWWLGAIIVGAVVVIVAIFSFIISGNKTEDISLNKSPDYKNYQERKQEKQQIEENEEKEELPKLKSFKD